MKKKAFFLVCLLVLGLFACNKQEETQIADNRPFFVDPEDIAFAISQSKMPDQGYRFANAQFQFHANPYATYHIVSAKKCLGIPSEKSLSPEAQVGLLGAALSDSPLRIYRIASAVSLLDSPDMVLPEQKEIIQNLIHSLYLPDYGCYTIEQDSVIADPYCDTVYATSLVLDVSSDLNLEIPPIDPWLHQAYQSTLTTETLTRENADAYFILCQMLVDHGFDISPEVIDSVFAMFENALEDIEKLKESSDIYFPLFLMDYEEMCSLFDRHSEKYDNLVIQALCNENGIRTDEIMGLDTLGLFATARALELAKASLSMEQIAALFSHYDSFMLRNGNYITPGSVSSDPYNTYYVDGISRILGISPPEELRDYCVSQKQIVSQGNLSDVLIYLRLLQQNDLMELIAPDVDSLIRDLQPYWNQLFSDPASIQTYLPAINSCMKIYELTSTPSSVGKETVESVVANFRIPENPNQTVTDLTELLTFLCLTDSLDGMDITGYCITLENALIELSESPESSKLYYFHPALDAFHDINHSISPELKERILEVLKESVGSNGLFKAGNTSDDGEDFRSTYYGLKLLAYIEKKGA